MGLRDEIEAYQYGSGLVSNQPTQPGDQGVSGNGVMYASLYWILMKRRDEIRETDYPEIQATFDPCFQEPGLLTRGPHQGDQEAFDDYVGITTMSYLLGLAYAREILTYGRLRNFYYQNVPASQWNRRVWWNAWLGKAPAIQTHLELAAGEDANLIKRWLWAKTLEASDANTVTNQDAPMIAWLMIQVAQNRGFKRCERAIEDWWWRLAHGPFFNPRGIVAHYLNPDHPISRYWQ